MIDGVVALVRVEFFLNGSPWESELARVTMPDAVSKDEINYVRYEDTHSLGYRGSE